MYSRVLAMECCVSGVVSGAVSSLPFSVGQESERGFPHPRRQKMKGKRRDHDASSTSAESVLKLNLTLQFQAN